MLNSGTYTCGWRLVPLLQIFPLYLFRRTGFLIPLHLSRPSYPPLIHLEKLRNTQFVVTVWYKICSFLFEFLFHPIFLSPRLLSAYFLTKDTFSYLEEITSRMLEVFLSVYSFYEKHKSSVPGFYWQSKKFSASLEFLLNEIFRL